MKFLKKAGHLPVLMIAFSAFSAAAEEGWRCKDQADRILARLQREVVNLSATELAAANRIVLDVCQVREQQVEAEVERAVQEVREEEQTGWFTESADKPGNKRLKRKTH